jgi:leucine dehydrogenase
MDIKLLSEIERRGHEQVVVFNYPRVGLKAIVAIHNTVLGPALGGCRMRLYTDEASALDDALRLAEGMTYKSALAGLDLGGGKSCLIVDPAIKEGRRELFLQFAKCLNDLGGRYITAEDMGTSVEDIMVLREVTKFAAGYSRDKGGSGDPSPWTALGTFSGIRAACERRFGTADLKGRHITVQGVGHVGMYLLKHLHEAGAKITVCDTVESRLEEARSKYGAEVVGLDAIYDVKCDVYSPSAIGQTVNRDTLPRLKCAIIGGAANNQLSDASMYEAITQRGITYCPDFAINAGGIISVSAEYIPGGWTEKWVTEKSTNIYNTIHKILEESEKRKRFTELVALDLAKDRIRQAEEKKLSK